jgi:hypothetical protein
VTLRNLRRRNWDPFGGTPAGRTFQPGRGEDKPDGGNWRNFCATLRQNFIFVEGVQGRVSGMVQLKNALRYPFDKNKIRYLYTKEGLKMLLEVVTKYN